MADIIERNTHPRRRGRWRRWVLAGLGVLLLVAGGGVGWVWWHLRASLPVVDGARAVEGLGGPVTLARDAAGIVDIEAASFEDAAVALGFAHAQDRFFQMDASRRRAAGELSALVGSAALPIDLETRTLRLRARAREMLARARPADRAVFEAYARGVNAGLASLGAAPFEYLVLRASPETWRAEDSVLTLLAMFLSLHDAGEVEPIVEAFHAAWPAPVADFLFSPSADWETPLTGGPGEPALVPGPEVVDLRRAPSTILTRAPSPTRAHGAGDDDALDQVPGSNAWAVAAARSGRRGALVANDMHLGLSVPNTWYRARLAWVEDGARHWAAGATMPGLPGIIAGSNGRVAWGFTNSYGDWSDLVRVEADARAERYRAGSGWRPFVRTREVVRVNGGDAVDHEVLETEWGPIVATLADGQRLALRWTALDPEAVSLRLFETARAQRLDEAIEALQRSGGPSLAAVIGDADGRIGWTIAGAIPRRRGFDGWRTESWSDGGRGWDGYLSPAEYPAAMDPDPGFLWSANNRLAEGEWRRAIGNGIPDLGARARQIRDGLAGMAPGAGVGEMRRLQLDDRALFLDRWRTLVLKELTPGAVAGHPERARFRQIVADEWNGRADPASVAYRLVRQFRIETGALVFEPFVARAREVHAKVPRLVAATSEGPLWALVDQRPLHLLNPRFDSWPALLVAAVDEVVGTLSAQGDLASRTWGEQIETRVDHPLGPGMAFAATWLNMPRLRLPGDAHMPRVQARTFGASERFAVEVGREEEGYFHMPGGQSGHPLSPHYRDMHQSWADGSPTPFLPGPAVSRLQLK